MGCGKTSMLLNNIEKWNDNDEFSRCIRAIQAIPESERGYRLTLLLARAYSNLAVLGDHGCLKDSRKVDEEMLEYAIALLKSIEDQGRDDADWHARMGYACWMTDDRIREALEHANRWKELEPGNKDAENLARECADYLRHLNHSTASAGGSSLKKHELYQEEEQQALEDHIRKYFGDFTYLWREELSPSPDIRLDICLIPPRRGHDYYTLVTAGMGAHRIRRPEEMKNDCPERTELLLNLPKDWKLDGESLKEEDWYWPIQLLRSAARLPIAAGAWFAWGHTIGLPEGCTYAGSNKFCSSMLLLPGVFGEQSYNCEIPGGKTITFYQVIPLYKEELDYKLKNGSEALVNKCPDEILEVIDTGRLNAVTDSEKINYDAAHIDDTADHLRLIEEKQLQAGELAVCNHMAIYLRWCIEQGLMSRGFLHDYGDIAAAVKDGSLTDLREFISVRLHGELSTVLLNRRGTGFTCWYNWKNRSTPYEFIDDIKEYALQYFAGKGGVAEELRDAAYLLVPWSEEYYKEASGMIAARFAVWMATEEYLPPVKKTAIAPENIRPLLPDDGRAEGCFAADSIIVQGRRVGSMYREEPDSEDRGWDSGWRFLADDGSDEFIDDEDEFGFYDLNTLCNYDRSIMPFLDAPCGTWLERGEDGEFHQVEEDGEE